MKKIILILFSAIYMMSSCDVVSKKSDISENTNDALNLVSYAENFEIYPLEIGYKLVIKYLSSQNEYYLLSDTVSIPNELTDKTLPEDDQMKIPYQVLFFLHQ